MDARMPHLEQGLAADGVEVEIASGPQVQQKERALEHAE
jgi:hypothetical protein